MMWTSLLGVQVRFGSKNVRTCKFVIYILTSLKTCSKQLTATPNPPTESVSYWWCQFFLKVSTTLRTWTLPIIYYMVRYYIINNVYVHSNIWLDLWDTSPWFENFHDAALIGFISMRVRLTQSNFALQTPAYYRHVIITDSLLRTRDRPLKYWSRGTFLINRLPWLPECHPITLSRYPSVTSESTDR